MANLENIKEAVQFIQSRYASKVEAGIVLGTGLGGLVKEIDKETEISYKEIPHFPVSTVESHAGKLIFGKIGKKKIVAMQGRFHYYEGYTQQQITFPIRVMKFLGISQLLISNAAGGINPMYRKGDLMIINDHINMLGGNPLIGVNNEDLGPRFPDMSAPYSPQLISLAHAIALELKIRVQEGVYVAFPGPNLETRAEYRFIKLMGADAVGMSTVPEVLVAVHMKLPVFAISVITDECFPDALKPTGLEEIIAVANKAEPNLTKIMKEIILRS